MSARQKDRDEGMQYLVRFHAQGVLLIEDGGYHRLQFRDAVVLVGNDHTIENDVREQDPRHVGSIFDVQVEATSPDDAFERAMGAALAAEDLLAFVHGAAIQDPEPQIAYQLEPADEELRMTQVFKEGPTAGRGRRLFRANWLDDFVKASNRLGDRDETARRRVTRALHQYRRGMLEPDLADRFVDLWQALEAINTLLQERYGLGTEREGRACRSCGTPAVLHDQSSGIKHVLGARWQELRDVRVAIVHATRATSELAADLPEQCAFLETSCVQAICSVLGVASASARPMERPALRFLGGPWYLVTGILVDYTPRDLLLADRGQLPRWELTRKLRERVRDRETGVWKEEVQASLKLVGPARQHRTDSLLVKGYLRPDPEDPRATFEVRVG